ncbi:MAG: histidine triad nucleotide-binding protein [Actinomycetota bacterium]
MADCLFCKIANKELDADIVYESDDVVAFRDINPGAPTHILVIPKRHLDSVRDLSSEDGALLAEMFTTMTSLAEKEGLERGYRIVTNVGPDAGQSVHHLHFHLLGGRGMSWPPG